MDILLDKRHLTSEGLIEVLLIKSTLKQGLSETALQIRKRL